MARPHALQTSLGALALGSVWWLQGRPRVLALGALMVLWADRPAPRPGSGWRTPGKARHWFTGKLGQAARLIWAPLCSLAIVAGLSIWAARRWSNGSPRLAGMIAAIPTALALYALLPYAWWHLQRYRQSHLAWGTLQMRFRGSALGGGYLVRQTGLVAVASTRARHRTLPRLAVAGGQVACLQAPMSTHQVYQKMWPALALFIGGPGSSHTPISFAFPESGVDRNWQ